jgi:hypothetical protein
MSADVITFPGSAPKSSRNVWIDDDEDEAPYSYRRRQRPYRDGAMHKALIRSYDLIVQSEDADLVRDVSFDIDRAQRKLNKIQKQLKSVQERAAARLHLLTTAETKLKAAIIAALLSREQ